MVRTNKKMEASRDRLLYDEARLANICDRLSDDGVPAKPTEIKRYVKTGAFIYEIRTALAYWHGSLRNTRTNDAIVEMCKAVEEGQMVFDGDELVPIQEAPDHAE
jgi:hypothetical protein